MTAALEPLLPDGAASEMHCGDLYVTASTAVSFDADGDFHFFWTFAGLLPQSTTGRSETHRETSEMRQLVRMMPSRMQLPNGRMHPADIIRRSWRMSLVSLWVTGLPVVVCTKAPELHAAASHACGAARDRAGARGAGRRAFSRRSSRYSSGSSVRCSVICVPRPRLGPSSRAIVNDPPACDSQMYCSSSLCCARAHADHVSARAALFQPRWQQGLQWERACIRPDMRSRRCP